MTTRASREFDGLSLREARRRYFEENGLGDGGYEDRWVKLQAGPVPIWFPNAPARVAAVRRHDLHHVVTGYGTTWTGEAEIGAWEIGSGCGRFWAAWVLNLQALAIGLVLAPPAVFRAFVRGRRERNLYRGELDEAWLEQTVADMRHRLCIGDDSRAAGPADAGRFSLWCVAAVATFLATALSTLAPVFVVVWLLVRWFG